MARPCAQNGSPLTPTHCTHLGSRRETKAGSTTSNMEKDSGKGDQGQRVKVMGRGGDSSETEQLGRRERVAQFPAWGNMEIDDEDFIAEFLAIFQRFHGILRYSKFSFI